MATRRPNEVAPDLRPRAVAVLLHGWGAEPPADVPRDAHGFGGGFLDLYTEGPGALWREHEAWLRGIARAWQWQPETAGPDGIRRFYGEHLAVYGGRR